jgi:hypothetical protein
MRLTKLRATLLAGAVVLAAGGAALGPTLTASAATGVICDQFGSTVQGQYYVQNNRWGTSATQCIDVTGNGFRITTQDGVGTTAPVSYPSIFYGCHYTLCSPGTALPKRVDTIGAAPTSVSYTFVGNATYDAAYDIWMDPTPKTTGVNQQEIMIWQNHTGSIQPVGRATGTATLAGVNWTVWTGNNGGNDVVSYVAPSAIPSMSFDVKPFLMDSIARGYGAADWYLTSVQAGFEPWSGGAGLAVTSFAAAVTDGGGGGTTPPATGTHAITGLGGMCVDVPGANSADRTPVQLYTCNHSAAQQWTVGADGTIRALGACLDINAASSANGTRVQIYQCNGTAAQQWTIGADHTIRGLGKCLDAGGPGVNGTLLQIWDCGTAQPNQTWTIA